MIVYSQAPTRLSLFGGGTDLPTYADKYGGLVLNMAINVYQKLLVTEEEAKVPTAYVPYANPKFYDLIKEEFGYKPKDIDIDQRFDGLIHSGMGSSASAAVALIGAINRIKNLGLSKSDIAERAWDIEVNKLGLYGGRQDQYSAVFGGVNLMEFQKDKVTLTPLNQQFIKPIIDSISLFYIGANRESSKIQEGFKELSEGQIMALDNLKALTATASEILAKQNIAGVGELLDLAWKEKKRSNKGVTTKKIDKIYEKAKKNGAWGGKICGAGGGGFMFFIVDPKLRDRFIKKMEKEGLTWWDFDVDWQGLSTRILPKQ